MSEIMTMGATPYPGMNRDKLYTFLKSKNVMDRPNECPSAIYEVMTACWNFKPDKRPKFEQIADMLAQVLQEKKQVK